MDSALQTNHDTNDATKRFRPNCEAVGYSPTGKLLTTEQAADVCGLASRTLQQYRTDGTGPAYIQLKGSKSIRYPEPLLLDWIVAGLRTNTAIA